MIKKVILEYSKAFICFIIIFFVVSSIGIGKYVEHQREVIALNDLNYKKSILKAKLNKKCFKENVWPKTIDVESSKYEIKYTFNDQLVTYIKKLLKRYRSDFTSVSVIDNETGKILAVVGYERKGNTFNNHLPFTSTHPTASLFKIVTAAGLLSESSVDSDSIFSYRGRGTTLYKYQLQNKKSRWSRRISLKNAFAYSNNVIFGKAAINNITSKELYVTANKLGFNSRLMTDVRLTRSIFPMAGSRYQLAEFASGFNKKTYISPIHAAVLSSIISNDGVMKYPYFIDKVYSDTGEEIEFNNRNEKIALDSKVCKELRQMMSLTVKRGTARGSFRRFKRYLRNNLEIGGKTGSLTGGVPYGKRDWFTAYARPKNSNLGRGISLSVMNINVEKWYVKSAFLARNIIDYYYSKVAPLRGRKVAALKSFD